PRRDRLRPGHRRAPDRRQWRQQPAQQRPGDDRHHPLPAAPQLHRPGPRARDEQRPHRPIRRPGAGRGAGAEGLRSGRAAPAAGSSQMTEFARGLRANFKLLDGGAGRIGLLRQAAFARFAELGLPTTQDEDWKYTSLAPLTQIQFVPPAETKPPTLEQLDRLAGGLPGDGAVRLVFVDGRYRPELSSRGTSTGSAFIGGLGTAHAQRPELVERELARHADYQRDALTALNTAFIEDGAFIHLPAGTVLQAPIHLLFV